MYKTRLQECQDDPVKFIEYITGKQLSYYDRILVKSLINKEKIYGNYKCCRNNEFYIRMCVHCLFMKENETVVIASPKENLKMNREELREWLQHYRD